MKAVLSTNPTVAVMASEEDDTAIACSSSCSQGGYAVVFDPLDGSRNIDAAIPTGPCC
jgi:fructose-1,6-bisphosphatase I